MRAKHYIYCLTTSNALSPATLPSSADSNQVWINAVLSALNKASAYDEAGNTRMAALCRETAQLRARSLALRHEQSDVWPLTPDELQQTGFPATSDQ